jgi:ribonuclease G
MLKELEEDTGKRFHFEGSEGLPLDHFDVILEGTRAEVEERALPFREGEEVLVQIVEPHMYNVDDAVAKIDGYIISVVAGGRHVGEKRLVRIDEVGRTAAVASLVDDVPGQQGGDSGEPDDDDVQSRPRRRGRRGGRRRSRARDANGGGDRQALSEPT